MADEQEQQGQGPFNQTTRSTFMSISGAETDPPTVWHGWVNRIPIEQAKIGHCGEWEQLPEELNGQVPTTIAGYTLDWSDVQVVDCMDFVNGDVIRMFRLPYRLPGAKPLPQP